MLSLHPRLEPGTVSDLAMRGEGASTGHDQPPPGVAGAFICLVGTLTQRNLVDDPALST